MTLLIVLAALLVYGLTRTHLNTFDAVAYANQVGLAAQTGKPRPLFHPHHLLSNALTFAAWRGARALGYTGGPLVVAQTLNAALGAAGLGLFYRTLRRLRPRGAGPAWMTLALGGSFGYWICATDGRVNLPSLVCLLAALDALVRPRGPRRAACLGLWGGLAVLFHESAALFVVVGASGVWLLTVRAKRPRSLAAYGLAWGLSVGLPYLGVGVLALGLRSPAAFRHWASAYAERGWWWDFHVLHNLRLDLFGLRHAVFVTPPGRAALAALGLPGGVGVAALGLLWLLYAASLAGLVLAGAALVRALPRLLRSPEGPLARVCLLWAGVYAAFFTIWCPGAFVFWVPALLPLGVLLLLALPRASGSGGKAGLALGVWAGGYALLNALAGIGPYLKPVAGLSQRVALEVKTHTPPRSLVVLAGVGDAAQAEVDVPYFGSRPVLSLHAVLAHAPDPAAARLSLETALDRAIAARRPVYVLDEVWSRRDVARGLARQSPAFPPDVLWAAFAQYHPVPAWAGARGTAWRLSAR